MRSAVLVLAAIVTACGGPMRTKTPSLERTAWIAQEIDGYAVVDRVQSTLELGADAQAGGTGGCNRYRTSAKLGDGTIELGPIAATRMACPPAAMDQERRFFTALAGVRRYEFDRGVLVLRDADGTVRVRLARLERS